MDGTEGRAWDDATDEARSDDVPHFLGGMAEFAAGNACAQTVVADTDGVVLEGVGEIVVALGHGTDEDTHALVGSQGLEVIPGPDNGRLVTERHLPAVGGQVIGDGVFDDLEQLLLRVGGADGETVQKLDHQTGEPLEGSRDANAGVDLDEDTFGRVDEDLQFTGLVDGGIEQGEKALETGTRSVSASKFQRNLMDKSHLMGDIGSRLTDIPIHFAHDTDVLVAVEQRILLITCGSITTPRGRPVGFQTGVREDDDQTLGILVMGGDRNMLLRDELGQLRGWARLRP